MQNAYKESVKIMNCATFMGECVREMMLCGVTIEFTKRKKSSGEDFSYFSEGENSAPKLKINYFRNNPDFYLGIFLHEYCHFLQWRDNVEIFKSANPSYIRFEEFLIGKRKTYRVEDIRAIQRVELDCNERAIALIKEKELPLDLQTYIQESNSYIIAHNYLPELKHFFKNSACWDSEVIALTPSHHVTEADLSKAYPDHRKKFFEKTKTLSQRKKKVNILSSTTQQINPSSDSYSGTP